MRAARIAARRRRCRAGRRRRAAGGEGPGRRCRWTARRCGWRTAGGRAPDAGGGWLSDAVIDPARLQVMAAALRGVADEMGAALVRAAHSANIKERRDCSTAVFDRDGRMIAQAEHMPVHLGAMPDAVAAVPRAAIRGRGELYVLNDPYTRRHAPARTSRWSSRVDELGLRGVAGASRRRRRDAAGQHAGRGDRAAPGGRRDPAAAADAGGGRAARRKHAPAGRAAGRPACPGRLPRAGRAAACASWPAARPRPRCGAGWTSCYAYSERRMRAAIGGLPDGRYRAADVIEGDGMHRRRYPHPDDGRDRAATLCGRLRRHRRPAAGERQLPARRSPARRSITSCALRVRPRPAGLGRRVRAGRRCGRRRAASSTRGRRRAVVAGNTETSSRIVDVVMPAFARGRRGAGRRARAR